MDDESYTKFWGVLSIILFKFQMNKPDIYLNKWASCQFYLTVPEETPQMSYTRSYAVYFQTVCGWRSFDHATA